MKKILFIQFILVVFLIIITDLVLSLFFVKDGHKEFRLKQPEPYLQADFFSSDFINESFFQPNGWIIDRQNDKIKWIKPKNFEGKWFNVKNHQRLTINSLGRYKNKLYLFGGSTVYGSEVPDSLSLASQLAYMGANSRSFEVVNMGASSVHSSHQFERLKHDIKLAKDDLVVFYDGVNDVLNRIVFENKETNFLGYPGHENQFIKLIFKASRFSSIAKLLLNRMIDNNNERQVSRSFIEKSINDYLHIISEAKAYVENAGGKFYHFLQPTLFTKKKHNDYEIFLINRGYPFVPKQVQNVFIEVYPVIEAKLATLNYSKSLTSAFDNLTVSPYLDFCHINHIGNKIIANKIWNILLKNL